MHIQIKARLTGSGFAEEDNRSRSAPSTGLGR